MQNRPGAAPLPQPARLTELVVEARGLHARAQEFAAHCVALGTLPDGGGTSPETIREVLRELTAAWSAIRNAEETMLRGCEAALINVLRGAFSREAERVFRCFEGMARDICVALGRGDRVQPAALSELVQFVSVDLDSVFGTVVSAACLVADMGTMDVQKQALTDPLTGLPNRRALHDLTVQMASNGWPHEQIAILQIDLDRFKLVNDTLGHAAGDAALCHAAEAIVSQLRPEDFVARIGGDEFVMVVFGAFTEAVLSQRAEALIAAVSRPFLYEDKDCRIGGSVGIAHARIADGVPLERLMTRADLALYAAKSAGRGLHRIYQPGLRTLHIELKELQSDIRDGLRRGDFEPFFQPQVDGRTGALVGLEALARWRHPVRGLLTPFHFLEAAADARLLDDLDHHIMDRTFATYRGWLDDGLPIPKISINLTSHRLVDGDLADKLVLAADRHGLEPWQVSLEILESVMIEKNADVMIDNIRSLSRAGFCVELDDFGTGHASISNLRNFKVDRIKIDKSFVKDVHIYSELAKITAAMIGLAHSLRVDALAEGVETPEERMVLNALGCDHIQGFGVSRPMPSGEVGDWIRRTQRPRVLPPRRQAGGGTPTQAAG